MSRSRLPDQLLAIGLLFCAVVGCKQLQRVAKPSVLKSADGKFQLTVPAGWRKDLSMNEAASIKASNPLQEMYAMVITEEKSDFSDEMTLQEYTEIVLESMEENVEKPDATSPLTVMVNGLEGRQYLLQGEVKNVKVTYLVTTVETAANFHQIVTWTLTSRISKNRTALQGVTDTFRPVIRTGTEGTTPTP